MLAKVLRCSVVSRCRPLGLARACRHIFEISTLRRNLAGRSLLHTSDLSPPALNALCWRRWAEIDLVEGGRPSSTLKRSKVVTMSLARPGGQHGGATEPLGHLGPLRAERPPPPTPQSACEPHGCEVLHVVGAATWAEHRLHKETPMKWWAM